jgi:hypothetical protein
VIFTINFLAGHCLFAKPRNLATMQLSCLSHSCMNSVYFQRRNTTASETKRRLAVTSVRSSGPDNKDRPLQAMNLSSVLSSVQLPGKEKLDPTFNYHTNSGMWEAQIQSSSLNVTGDGTISLLSFFLFFYFSHRPFKVFCLKRWRRFEENVSTDRE